MTNYFPEDQFIAQEKELEIARQQANMQNVQQDVMAAQMRESETNLVREQLSLDEELETIEHLLRGHILKPNKEGIQEWKEPVDKSMVILTDHGVHMIMNTIMFYLNKNTLLSNYPEELINKKMEDFANSLSDALFMESDLAFVQPTNAEAVERYESQLKLRVENKLAIAKLEGHELDYEDERQKVIASVDVEKTIFGIKEQMKKDKLKRFELIIREVQDAVHSTYLRAWNGQERRTLRQHITISESTGNHPVPMPKQRRSPLSFFRR